MLKTLTMTALVLGVATAATAAVNTNIRTTEERMAHEEEGRIIERPIGGFENRFWFDYRINLTEARKELASDLRGASDTEDLLDAWDEYRGELSHERGHYIKEMAERGVRYGTVSVGS